VPAIHRTRIQMNVATISSATTITIGETVDRDG
jgi:hypothetical protein